MTSKPDQQEHVDAYVAHLCTLLASAQHKELLSKFGITPKTLPFDLQEDLSSFPDADFTDLFVVAMIWMCLPPCDGHRIEKQFYEFLLDHVQPDWPEMGWRIIKETDNVHLLARIYSRLYV